MREGRRVGVAEDADGLLLLADRPELGTPINAVLPAGDVVLDIEITPNRPDCTAVSGIARDLGATLNADSEVEGVAIENGAVKGVRVGGGVVPYDKVISNMDAVRTYRELVGGEVGRAYEKRSFEPACSGVVLYLGLNKRYDHLAHHDFVFSRDPEEEFDAIYRKGEPAPDPTAYLAAPSSTDPTVAPEGGEALYVLVHTPYLRPHHDWSKMLPVS